LALTPGTRLGVYEIVALIGAGGMGEVYRARDPRLGRDVAIKVLPADISADPGRLRRSEQEARAAAALNHPNIVTIYSVEQAGDIPFVTMELVEGAALARLIPRAGLPLARTLPIAIALVDAVATAHARGIVHRDLKPSNVMVLPDDRVKVLDFGLAKLLHSQLADLGATALATEPITDPGLVVGTLPYMSPEQVQGKAVDHRSDIFSLGVMLYEMTTGQRPFKGDTNALLLSSILKDTPPLASDVSTGVPRDLGRIIRHSLAKDPSQRYQTALDLRNELAELQQDLSSGSLHAPVPQGRAGWSTRSIGAAAAVAIAVGAAVMFVVWRPGGASPRPATQENFTFDQLTTETGVRRYPSLSPDGKWVVYEGYQTGNADIYLQSVGGHNPINLTKDSLDDDTQPAFSPDGESIAFRSSRQGNGIFVMGRTGESVRRLTDGGFNPAWSPDGTKIVYATDDATVFGRNHNSELWTVSVGTGEKRKIFDGDGVQPSWSPNGLRIAFWQAFGEHQGQRDILTIPAEGGAPVAVTSDAPLDWSPVWARDGRSLYFSSDRGGPMNLWRVPINERTGKALGPPEALSAPSSSAGLLSLSADGRAIAYTSFISSQTIQRVAFDPVSGVTRGVPVTVIGGSRRFDSPRPSPDGRWLTFFSQAPQMDIFVIGADGTGIRQLTNDRANDKYPGWSPDGQQIAFMSNRDGMNQIWSINPDGSGLHRLTAWPTGATSYAIWSPDGSKMLAHVARQVDHEPLKLVFDPCVKWERQTPVTFLATVRPGIRFVESSWSPDGLLIAGTAAPEGRNDGSLGVYSLTSSRYEKLFESDSAADPLWLNDGRSLMFDEKSRLMLIDSRTHATRELMSVAPDTMELSSITRDNQTVYFVRYVQQEDIWLMRSK